MFQDKVALVTGAGSGIGRAVALAFAAEGARLALADVDLPGLDRTVDQVRAGGGEAWSTRVDVSKADEVEAYVKGAAARFGRLDFAVNNAGIRASVNRVADYSADEFDRVIAINLKGVWLCMKYEIEEMLRGGGGTIVNIASGAGLVGVPNSGIYVAAKHGVVGLTRSGALDYARSNIRINAICPGHTRTPMALGSISDKGFSEAQAAEANPMGRLCEPSEQADAVLYLCSGKSSFVTGQAFAVDGGYTTQ